MKDYQPSPNLTMRVLLEDGRLPKEMLDWLEANIDPVLSENTYGLIAEGETWGAWFIRDMGRDPSIISFRFKTMDQTLLFKLRWYNV
jgi:hypothetical protein